MIPNPQKHKTAQPPTIRSAAVFICSTYWNLAGRHSRKSGVTLADGEAFVAFMRRLCYNIPTKERVSYG
jgi:hypothetical protein